MIFVDHLTKEYGPTRALDKVTFMVAPGETVGFLGPNGAGKTTTMRIMTALFPPSSGDVTIDGYSVRTHPLEVKRRIGYLSESAPLYGEMSVEGYLRFVAEAAKDHSDRAAGRKHTRRSQGVRSGERPPAQYANAFEGIQTKRVGLAQALLGDPPVIILDEPTARPRSDPDRGVPAAVGEAQGRADDYSKHPYPARGKHDLRPGGYYR